MASRFPLQSTTPFVYRLFFLVAIVAGGVLPGFLVRQCQAQSIELKLSRAEPLPESLYTFNANLLTGIAFQGYTYDGPQFESAVRQLQPRGLRFPGGTIANNYLWQSDSLSEPTNDKTVWAGEHIRLFRKIGRPFDLPGFARLCKRYNVSPLWVLNIYEETPDSVVQLMDEMDKRGVRIKAVEMANEPYWDGRSFNDVKAYIRFCRPLAKALKQRRPNIQIGACFAPLGNPANYEAIWNKPLAQENWFDAIVFHDYYGGQGFVLEEGANVPVEAMLHPKELIDVPVKAFAKLLPGKPIWFTEWNTGIKGLDQWKNTGAELHFIAATMDRLIHHRKAIPRACFHDLYDSRFGTFFYDEKSGKVQTNASWHYFRLLGLAMAGAESLRPIVFPKGELHGFATQRGKYIALLLVNRGATALTVTLPQECRGEQVRLSINCPPEKSLPLSVPLTEQFPIETRQVTLPPYSINLLGPRATVNPKPVAASDDNLFRRIPHLTLWYEPFASEEPRFDPDGIYAIEVGKFRDKPLAVVKMNLASLSLPPAKYYTLEFEAKVSGAGGMVIKVPDMAKPDAKGEKERSVYAPLL